MLDDPQALAATLVKPHAGDRQVRHIGLFCSFAEGFRRARVMAYPFHESITIEVSAPPERLFERLDDHTRLAAHMGRPSLMMLGGRMTYAFDDDAGRAVGSVIHMGGRVLGIPVGVVEVVTEHDPPRRKVWETVGRPRLLIIGRYRMGFEIEPKGAESVLHVFIDFALPASPTGRLLGRLFVRDYARWCVRRMAADAVRQG